MEKINVCLVSPSYPTEVEPYSAFFIRDQAVALSKIGCKISVVAPRIYGKGDILNYVDSIPVYNFSFKTSNKRLSEFKRIPPLIMASYVLTGIKKLFRVIRQEQVNVIHAHWALPSGFIAIIVGKYLRRRPVILTAHGSDITVLPKRSVLARFLVRFVLKRADYVIAVSELIKNQITDEYKIDKAKISLIRLGVDFDSFKPIDRAKARLKLGLPTEKQILLYVGDLVEVKGLKYLIEAMPSIIKSFPNVMLALIGQGSLEKTLRKEVQSLGLEDSIKFIGPKAHDEIPYWMNAADVLVLPSLSEGAPVSIMEAMAIGLPIVASKVGGIPELVEDGLNGFLIEPQNTEIISKKIKGVLENPVILAQVKTQQRIGIDSNENCHKIFNIYKQILTDTGR